MIYTVFGRPLFSIMKEACRCGMVWSPKKMYGDGALLISARISIEAKKG